MLATAKIHILKQFTTVMFTLTCAGGLCLLLQRYTFWSNSQHETRWLFPASYCACYCKDTHFEAIHNYGGFRRSLRVLCLLLQRYTFWSNSQLISSIIMVLSIVLATAKIHILKQFTTQRFIVRFISDCACYCKDTHFEAIHNAICNIFTW